MGNVFVMQSTKLVLDPIDYLFECYKKLSQEDAKSVVALNEDAEHEIQEYIGKLSVGRLTTTRSEDAPLSYKAIAKKGDEIVGFCYGSATNTHNELKVYNVYEINMLYVKPEHRKNLVGRNLIRSLQNYVLSNSNGYEIKYFKAITQPENISAIKVLELIGYTSVENIQNMVK